MIRRNDDITEILDEEAHARSPPLYMYVCEYIFYVYDDMEIRVWAVTNKKERRQVVFLKSSVVS